MRAAEYDPRIACRTRQDPMPLLDQRLGMVGAHPVHVIEQHETRNRAAAIAQEIGDGAGVRLDAFGQAGLERRKVVRLQILRTALARVMPAQIDGPEVVVPHRQVAEHILDSVAHEARDAVRVLGLHFLALRMRHTQHAERDLTRECPVETRRPQ